MDVDIRSARASDTEAVLALWRDATVPSATDDVAAIGQLLAHDPDALVIATIAGRVVGTLIAGFDGWRGQMYRLVVAEDARRSGIARALVGHAERALRRRGARRISALVIDDATARTFWRSVGYVEDELDRRFVKTVVEAAPR